MDTPVVRPYNTSKRCGFLTALDGLTLEVARGEIVGLFGVIAGVVAFRRRDLQED